ncbi:MAG: hypothetical protein MRK01_16110 [Candidatus Scalindua sp.]|nr:hypothetical protein [Candidatus Scalindua sp.]
MRFSILFLLSLSIFLFVSLEEKWVYAIESQWEAPYVTVASGSAVNHDTCTERCHVDFMNYEVEFEYGDKREIFRHGRHLLGQEIDCISCHEESMINTDDDHGKLLINQEDCLSCHHVESEELECKTCHLNIDANPMKYNRERFVHGFTVYDGVDCGLCHRQDPTASLKKEINCIKCHHTTPDLDCIKCHKEELKKSFTTDSLRAKELVWSVAFDHSAHPEQKIRCEACHVITEKNYTGILKYRLNCSKCHHLSGEEIDCIKCHIDPFEFSRGKKYVEGVGAEADLMSVAVTCKDCHSLDNNSFKFLEVREKCVGCHNTDYGELHDAWITSIGRRSKRVINHSISLPETDKNLLSVVQKNGMHNFNLAGLLLDYLEGKRGHVPDEVKPDK